MQKQGRQTDRTPRVLEEDRLYVGDVAKKSGRTQKDIRRTSCDAFNTMCEKCSILPPGATETHYEANEASGKRNH